eukprot:TRINITY_DN4574_c0_g1_i1.p1 TRINITY_DN4574_c0_g1~~TRINITY_DN4574_c0_g1_i1.p1  ORF type:complete len:1262 (-),score=219.90 TRINITY_DN4574_c0_g1_i1:14-3799(-)
MLKYTSTSKRVADSMRSTRGLCKDAGFWKSGKKKAHCLARTSKSSHRQARRPEAAICMPFPNPETATIFTCTSSDRQLCPNCTLPRSSASSKLVRLVFRQTKTLCLRCSANRAASIMQRQVPLKPLLAVYGKVNSLFAALGPTGKLWQDERNLVELKGGTTGETAAFESRTLREYFKVYGSGFLNSAGGHLLYGIADGKSAGSTSRRPEVVGVRFPQSMATCEAVQLWLRGMAAMWAREMSPALVRGVDYDVFAGPITGQPPNVVVVDLVFASNRPYRPYCAAPPIAYEFQFGRPTPLPRHEIERRQQPGQFRPCEVRAQVPAHFAERVGVLQKMESLVGTRQRTVWQVTGPAGMGKTTAALHVLHQCKSRGWKTLCLDLRGVRVPAGERWRAVMMLVVQPPSGNKIDDDALVHQYRGYLLKSPFLLVLDHIASWAADDVEKLLPSDEKQHCVVLVVSEQQIVTAEGSKWQPQGWTMQYDELDRMTEAESVQIVEQFFAPEFEATPELRDAFLGGEVSVLSVSEGCPFVLEFVLKECKRRIADTPEAAAETVEEYLEQILHHGWKGLAMFRPLDLSLDPIRGDFGAEAVNSVLCAVSLFSPGFSEEDAMGIARKWAEVNFKGILDRMLRLGFVQQRLGSGGLCVPDLVRDFAAALTKQAKPPVNTEAIVEGFINCVLLQQATGPHFRLFVQKEKDKAQVFALHQAINRNRVQIDAALELLEKRKRKLDYLVRVVVRDLFRYEHELCISRTHLNWMLKLFPEGTVEHVDLLIAIARGKWTDHESDEGKRAITAARIFGDKARTAAILKWVADRAFSFNKLEEAKKAFEEAYSLFAEVYADDVPPNMELASTLHALGQVSSRLDEDVPAEEYFKKSLALKKEIYGDVSNSDMAMTLHSLGLVCSRRDEFVAAEQYLTQALAMSKQVQSYSPTADVAATLHALGDLHCKREQYAEAKEYYRQSLAIKKLVYGDTPNGSVASALHALGLVCFKRDENAAAEEYYKQALAMCKHVYGNTPNISIATALFTLGQVCQKRQDYRTGEKYYKQSLAMFRSIGGDANIQAAVALHEIGNVYRDRNDCATAEKYYLEALELKRSIYGEAPSIAVASTLHELSGLYIQRDDTASARSLLTKAFLKIASIPCYERARISSDYFSFLLLKLPTDPVTASYVRTLSTFLQRYNRGPQSVADELALMCEQQEISEFLSLSPPIRREFAQLLLQYPPPSETIVHSDYRLVLEAAFELKKRSLCLCNSGAKFSSCHGR